MVNPGRIKARKGRSSSQKKAPFPASPTVGHVQGSTEKSEDIGDPYDKKRAQRVETLK
jgi:hypothetical protein